MNSVTGQLGNGEVLVIEPPTMGVRELRQVDYVTWQANKKRLEREARRAVSSPDGTTFVSTSSRKDSR